MSRRGEFGSESIPYAGLFIAYGLGALIMSISEQLALLVFGVVFIGCVSGTIAVARVTNHAE